MNEVIYTAKVVAAGAGQTPQRGLAIYTTDGVVREAGEAAAIRRAHPTARIVDAGDATILPGLTDAHGHLYGLGLSLDTVNLVGSESYEEVIQRTKTRASSAAANDWILGRGWDQNRWPSKEFPTAALLDAAIPDHPVWLRRVDGHAGIANSAAMRVAGITAATKDPAGGRVLRDPSGNPTGVFIDEGMSLIDTVVPPASFELRKQRVLAAANDIASNGLTEMHDAGADNDTIRAIQELIGEKKFPIRVYTMLTDDDQLLKDWFRRGRLIGFGGRLTVRAVKVYADGALGSRGAALLEPYSDDAGNSGLEIATTDHILRISNAARRSGFQVCTHAIGDRGVENVITAYEQAGAKPEERFRIEHFQVVDPADFARVARSGIIASMQPTHATSDMGWAEARLGHERVKGAYAWRTVLNAGVHLPLGSDFPVESVNPFYGLYSAVARQDQNGKPPGGWMPDQRLTLAEALRGFTTEAAYAAFEEGSRGTIEPGRLADFTIVEGDFFARPVGDLFSTKVKYTVVGGEIVYEGK